MNILVLTHRPLYPPVYGYSRVITDTYSAIVSQGHRVCVVSIVPKRRVGKENFNEINYVELNEPLDVFTKLAITRALLRISRGELLFYHLSWLTKAYASQNIIESVRNIVRKYLGDPDIIIAETIYPGFLAEKLAEKMGVKHVIRIHNIESQYISSLTKLFERKAIEIIGSLETNILSKAHKIYALSYKDSLTIKILYNIDATYIPPILITEEPCYEEILGKFGIERNNYYLFIASPHKPNILFLKKIMECWRNLRIRGYKLVVGGSISPIAKKLLNKYYNKDIIVTGLLSKEEVIALTKYAYVYLAPHHGHGVPIKLVEALQLGVPAITTINALQSITGLKDKENVCTINNIDEICKAIEILAIDKTLYVNIKEGVNRFSRNLDYRKITKMFINELASMII